MASTTFQDFNQNTPVVASWLNDVNKAVYSPGGVPRVASLIPVAWVRFSISVGVVTIQQSVNIATVVRNSAGVFLINYGSALTSAACCCQIAQSVAGFASYGSETTSSIVITTTNPSNVPTDPGTCSVVIWGIN